MDEIRLTSWYIGSWNPMISRVSEPSQVVIVGFQPSTVWQVWLNHHLATLSHQHPAASTTDSTFGRRLSAVDRGHLCEQAVEEPHSFCNPGWYPTNFFPFWPWYSHPQVWSNHKQAKQAPAPRNCKIHRLHHWRIFGEQHKLFCPDDPPVECLETRCSRKCHLGTPAHDMPKRSHWTWSRPLSSTSHSSSECFFFQRNISCTDALRLRGEFNRTFSWSFARHFTEVLKRFLLPQRLPFRVLKTKWLLDENWIKLLFSCHDKMMPNMPSHKSQSKCMGMHGTRPFTKWYKMHGLMHSLVEEIAR